MEMNGGFLVTIIKQLGGKRSITTRISKVE